MLPSLLVFVATAAGGWGLSRALELASYPKLLGAGTVLFAAFGVATWFVALNADDKRFIRQFLPFGRERQVRL